MGYNLQKVTGTFKTGKNILASEHLQYVEGGVTLKAGQGVFAVGQLIAREIATGKWVKYVDANLAQYDQFGILNVDADATTYDCVVGEVIVRGSVYEAKLPQAPTANFKDKVPMIRFVNHV